MKFMNLLPLLIIYAWPALAEIEFHSPIDCTLGKDCIIQQFMDHDKSTGVLDYQCQATSYDGHKGTDFRVSVRDMQRGVDILAANEGVVLGVRNAMADKRAQTEADFEAVKGKECGNGVVVRHSNGWETQYCHLKRGSVGVQKGDKVKVGDVLGQVGLSGRTQFPHLHLSVRKDDVPIDPFSAAFAADSCGSGSEVSLWSKEFSATFPDQPTQIAELGLADRGPTLDEVMDGDWLGFVASKDAPLVAFGLAVNGQTGDQLGLLLEGPSGLIVQNLRPPLERRKAQWFGFAGKKAPNGGWSSGEYRLTIEVRRNGNVLQSRTETHKID